MKARSIAAGLAFSVAAASAGHAQESEEDLAKKLQNPVADLISVPFQNNFDFNGGPRDNGFGYILNVQPVIPITLTDDWNLILRTIVPFINQDRVFPTGTESGMGDIVQSFFLSPKKPGPGGIVWGLGPVFLYPSATNDRLGSLQWGAGPTAVILAQDSGWTYGILANHIWSLTGKRAGKPEVNATFLQPFLSYTFPTKTTLAINTEATYDWTRGKWTVPINPGISQLLKIGPQPLSLGLTAKFFAVRPEGAPDWGLRFTVTFLFPK